MALIIMVSLAFVKGLVAANIAPSVLRDFQTWQLIHDRTTDSPSFEKGSEFLLKHQDWPSVSLLSKNLEKLITSRTNVKKIIEFYKVFTPVSYVGFVRYLRAIKKRKSFLPTLRRIWPAFKFSDNQLQSFIKEFGENIRSNDYIARINYQFYKKNLHSAFAIMHKIPQGDQKIIRKALQIQDRKHFSKSETKTITNSLKKYPGLVYIVIHSFIQSDNYEGANRILLNAKYQVYENQNPELWWPLRNICARTAIRHKQYETAYKLVSMHQLKKGGTYVDAQWLKGWIGMTLLGKVAEAAGIFQDLYYNVTYPVSLSRMACWAGFAYKEIPGMSKLSTDFFQKAANQPQTYYGQIAIASLGRNGTDSRITFYPLKSLSKTKKAKFNDYVFVQIIEYLAQSDIRDRAHYINIFFESAMKSFTDPLEKAELIQLAHKIGHKHMRVHLSKRSANSTVVSKEAYPTFKVTSDLKKIVNDNMYLIAMAHAIARQESSFNPKAVSSADAKGLMQLLVPVAKQESRYIKKHYGMDVPPKVFNEADNVMLGTSHMQRLFKHYMGRIVKCLSAYNAGAAPLEDWEKTYGNPGKMTFDEVVQWVELIPYAETREYIMRVSENFVVYLYRLGIVDGFFDFSKVLTESIFDYGKSN